MTDRDLTCSELDERLGDYLEGTLDDSSVADVELHLSGCAECAALVRDFERITRDAAALPAPAPSHDLWPDISARLDTRVLTLASRDAAPGSTWKRVRTGALAAGLVGITAVVTYSLTSRDSVRHVASAPNVSSDSSGTATVAPAPSPAAPPLATQSSGSLASEESLPLTLRSASTASSATRRTRVEAKTTYDAEISALRGVLTQRGEQLDPRTVAILETSLSTIDSAIAEARRALVGDPASRFLSQQLNKALEKK
ncbi:MAG: zf-HC2 domain-containing protein, partial [Gemmatimonadaceae bacterium]|nr:zf-HC2 domain-containing protein [Gemmatimonadaceae bacterium]